MRASDNLDVLRLLADANEPLLVLRVSHEVVGGELRCGVADRIVEVAARSVVACEEMYGGPPKVGAKKGQRDRILSVAGNQDAVGAEVLDGLPGRLQQPPAPPSPP